MRQPEESHLRDLERQGKGHEREGMSPIPGPGPWEWAECIREQIAELNRRPVAEEEALSRPAITWEAAVEILGEQLAGPIRIREAPVTGPHIA